MTRARNGAPAHPDPDWCSTDHGSTTHPDDEDHRSAGLAVPVAARRRGSRGAPFETDLEVGLLRRLDDVTTWLVIEDGDAVHLEITVESARRLVAAIRADPALRAALDGGDGTRQ